MRNPYYEKLDLPFPYASVKKIRTIGYAEIEKVDTIRIVAKAGASIGQLNRIRKELSIVKGGRLAEAAYPAKERIRIALGYAKTTFLLF